MLVTSSPNKRLSNLQNAYLSKTGRNPADYTKFVDDMIKTSKLKEFAQCVVFLVDLGDFREALRCLQQRIKALEAAAQVSASNQDPLQSSGPNVGGPTDAPSAGTSTSRGSAIVSTQTTQHQERLTLAALASEVACEAAGTAQRPNESGRFLVTDSRSMDWSSRTKPPCCRRTRIVDPTVAETSRSPSETADSAERRGLFDWGRV